jgi:hypothetical protein
MYRLCALVLLVPLLAVATALAQEKSILILVPSSDGPNNADLQGRDVTSLTIDKEHREKMELAKAEKLDGAPPPVGTYHQLVVNFMSGRKSRVSDLFFSEDLPKGTKIVGVKQRGKTLAHVSSIGGKTLVRPKKMEMFVYEATAVLPRLK